MSKLEEQLKQLKHAYSMNQKTLDRLNKWCEAETGFCLDTLQLIQSDLQEQMSSIVQELAESYDYENMIEAYR